MRLLFAFWNRARRGEADALYLSNGMARQEDVTAPLAVYRHSGVSSRMERLVLIQHGSYLIADIESQPYIDRGEGVLYRGVQNAELFLFRRLITADIRLRFISVHALSLADSVTSFNAVVMYQELKTGWFNDRSFMLGDLCMKTGLEPEPSIMSLLYSGYALEESSIPTGWR